MDYVYTSALAIFRERFRSDPMRERPAEERHRLRRAVTFVLARRARNRRWLDRRVP